jgi:uncharacterized membrane protein YbhN (UPF0104 family)
VCSAGSKPLSRIPELHPALKTAIQVVLSIALLSALFFLIDPGQIADALLHADSSRVIATLLLVPVNVFLTIVVWWILLKLIDNTITLRSASLAVMAGYALAVVTPARIGELGARVYYHRELGKKRLVGAFAVQGIYRTALYFLGGTIAIYYATRTGFLDASLWIPVAMVAFAGTSLFVVAGLNPGIIVSLMSRIPFISGFSLSLDFVDKLSGRTTWKLFIVSSIRYLTTISQFSLMLYAMGIRVGSPVLMSGSGFVFFIKSFVPNLFFTDLGIREGAAAFFFQSMGNFGPEAVAAALGLFAINAVLPAIAGIPALWSKPESGESA